jgi:hypothetical protein
MLGRVLYVGDAPLEYFWNKESSEDLREWKKARQAAISPSTKSVDNKAQPSQQESALIAPSASQPAQNDQQEKRRQAEESLSQAQYAQQQRISQLT